MRVHAAKLDRRGTPQGFSLFRAEMDSRDCVWIPEIVYGFPRFLPGSETRVYHEEYSSAADSHKALTAHGTVTLPSELIICCSYSS